MVNSIVIPPVVEPMLCEDRRVAGRIRIALLAATLLLAPAAPCIARGATTTPRLSTSQEQNPVAVTRQAMDAAGETVFAVVYKFNEPGLLESVSQAVRRGVDVRLLIDGKSQSKKTSDDSLAARARSAGADVRFWPRKLGKLHAKFTVVDGELALTGSYNWTRSALDKNLELLIAFEDPASVRRMSELFQLLWEQAAATE